MLDFVKMQGAGNDFVAIDNRKGQFPTDTPELIRKICDRRLGIGGDGVLLLGSAPDADVSMRFFNPDGGEADMCGNAARCAAQLAAELLQIESQTLSLSTHAGIVTAHLRPDNRVMLELPDPTDVRLDQSLKTATGMEVRFSFLNTGVPHVVIRVHNVEAYDLQRFGREIRYHEAFAPEGANVNLAHVTREGELQVRTYERGVEGETLACGTGVVASALAAVTGENPLPSPVNVHVAGGEVLKVGFRVQDHRFTEVTLEGPAVKVFEGRWYS